MPALQLRPPRNCVFDQLSLGEIMLRFDPGEGRVRTAREFKVWEGGGEYNVARGLRRCFGLRTAVVTSFPENDIGRLAEDFVLQGGVDTRFIQWVPFDGIGHTARVGLNFTERGFGVRGAVGISDRANSAASQMKPGQVDWDHIFGKLGVRWFHTGGIFAALSETTAPVVMEAVKSAKRHGAIVSYDLNYRPSLWKSTGGPKAAQEVNRAIAPFVDVMLGNEEDFTACLGFEVEGQDKSLSRIDVMAFRKMIRKVTKAFPNFKVVASTLRVVKSATVNEWGAVAWAGGKFFSAEPRKDLLILDRVGGGDSFAAGLIYGLLTFNDLQKAVNYGAAHGALAMTTPGDTSMATLKEVEALVDRGSARVQR